MKRCLMMAVLCLVIGAGLAVAQESDERIVEIWTCELKDGKTIEEVQEINSRWLVEINEALGDEAAASYVLENVVGSPTKFHFIDSYPNLEAWAKAKRAGQTDAFDNFDAAFDEVSDCPTNTLHRANPS